MNNRNNSNKKHKIAFRYSNTLKTRDEIDFNVYFKIFKKLANIIKVYLIKLTTEQRT